MGSMARNAPDQSGRLTQGSTATRALRARPRSGRFGSSNPSLGIARRRSPRLQQCSQPRFVRLPLGGGSCGGALGRLRVPRALQATLRPQAASAGDGLPPAQCFAGSFGPGGPNVDALAGFRGVDLPISSRAKAEKFALRLRLDREGSACFGASALLRLRRPGRGPHRRPRRRGLPADDRRLQDRAEAPPQRRSRPLSLGAEHRTAQRRWRMPHRA